MTIEVTIEVEVEDDKLLTSPEEIYGAIIDEVRNQLIAKAENHD